MTDGFRGQVAYISSLGSRASEWLFYALIFVFPFFTLPTTIFPVALNKSYLVYFGILIIGIIYLISSLQTGTLRIPKGLAGVFLLVFLVSLAVSSLFSVSPHSSFAGIGSEPGTLSAIGIFVLTLIFAFMVLDSEEKGFRALFSLFASFFVLVIFQIFQSLIKVPLLPSIGRELTFNLFGSWNELGVFAGLIVLLATIFIESLPKSFLKIILWVVLALSLLVTAVVNFDLVWWVLAGVLIVFLAYNFSQRRESAAFSKVTFGVLLISMVFIFSKDLTTDIVSGLGIQSVEVRPNLEFTLKTASKALTENAAFGYGPNTFLYAWFDHRPTDILNTPFWQTRFNSGIGYIPTLLVTTGLVGIVLLLAFIFSLIYYGFKALVMSSNSPSFLILASFAGALYLWVFAFAYSGGFSLLFPLFLLTGLFLSLAMKKGALDYYEISLFEHSVSGFIGALSLILFIVLGVSWVSIFAQKYYAAVLYGEGVKSTALNELDKADDMFTRAIKFDRRDLYLRTFADLGILRLQEIVAAAGSAPTEEMRLRFQETLGKTLQNAQDASDTNSRDMANWMTLGRIYEAVIPFQIQGAADLSIDAYKKAGEAFKTSPEPLMAAARVEVARNDLPKARELLQSAIAIKGDLAQAHFLIAQIEAASGNAAASIKATETTALLVPNDVGVLFQLGLLYYQNGRIPEAEAVFARAVSINSSYSNARYFLGLIYAKAGATEKALGEFKKIEELNPGNAEVKKIIENLSAGKDPLFEISPPGPEPAKRGTAPVEE